MGKATGLQITNKHIGRGPVTVGKLFRGEGTGVNPLLPGN